MTKTGVFKWFSSPRGYGFIETAEGDIFIHAHALKRSGLDDFDLVTGDRVSFTTAPRHTDGTGEQVREILSINGDTLT